MSSQVPSEYQIITSYLADDYFPHILALFFAHFLLLCSSAALSLLVMPSSWSSVASLSMSSRLPHSRDVFWPHRLFSSSSLLPHIRALLLPHFLLFAVASSLGSRSWSSSTTGRRTSFHSTYVGVSSSNDDDGDWSADVSCDVIANVAVSATSSDSFSMATGTCHDMTTLTHSVTTLIKCTICDLGYTGRKLNYSLALMHSKQVRLLPLRNRYDTAVWQHDI